MAQRQREEIDPRTKIMVQKARAGVADNSVLIDGLFTANNFDGLKASAAW